MIASFAKYCIQESFDSLKPVPIVFGSNETWDDSESYTDGKFAHLIDSLYWTRFHKDGLFFQVLYDKVSGEISFQVSKSSDMTSFSDIKIGVSVNVVSLFSSLLWIIERLIAQMKPTILKFSSKEHTKTLYNGFWKSKSLRKEVERLGFHPVSLTSGSDDSNTYTYKKS